MGMGECDLLLDRCGWVWVSVTFFWLGVGECDPFFGWVWVSVTFFGWVWVGVGECMVYNSHL